MNFYVHIFCIGRFKLDVFWKAWLFYDIVNVKAHRERFENVKILPYITSNFIAHKVCVGFDIIWHYNDMYFVYSIGSNWQEPKELNKVGNALRVIKLKFFYESFWIFRKIRQVFWVSAIKLQTGLSCSLEIWS